MLHLSARFFLFSLEYARLSYYSLEDKKKEGRQI